MSFIDQLWLVLDGFLVVVIISIIIVNFGGGSSPELDVTGHRCVTR
jgi:hypothetical protein